MLVAADVYRPAAIDQLQTLGERIGVPVYAPGADVDPVDIARDGVAFARAATATWRSSTPPAACTSTTS